MIKEQLSSGRMRMIGWMDVGVVVMHNMLFRGRSEDKEELDESVFEEQQKKGYICPQFYFYCRSIIGACIYIYLSMFLFFLHFSIFLFSSLFYAIKCVI